ncbi:MAG: enoyl-CoA hydratase/isomerase family protein [Planctomycetaceae bacterium]|nr:enoyl-CoA hydratase/isomerase family protein [Planctomycetaceae bacterium]
MLTHRFHHFRTEDDGHGRVTVWIDVEHRSMNVFHTGVLDELDEILTDLSHDHTAKAVVFRSAKPAGFFAGADVHQIASLSSEVQAHNAAARGHQLFDRLERLPMPTVAVIHGPCLGGGLEFALACRYRIAVRHATTQLGLPEIRLGLIPGWGGTQRLPKLIGLTEALPLILSGTTLNASDALRKRLVDAVCSKEELDHTINAVLDERLQHAKTHGGLRQRIMTWLLNCTPVGRRIVLQSAKHKTAREAKHYPALSAALTAVQAAFDPYVDGKVVEREQFSRLISTPAAHHLIHLFLWREQARACSRKASDNVSRYDRQAVAGSSTSDSSATAEIGSSRELGLEAAEPPLRSIAVIGAGAMGAGIALLAARRGLIVVVKELNDLLVAAARDRIVEPLEDLVKRRRITTDERDAILRRMIFTSMWEPLRDADVAIEAVVEQMDVKQTVLRELDQRLLPDAVLVSNTSALNVSAMAAATSRPDRIAGLHFFNPVHRMELVEVVRAHETSDATIQRLMQLARVLGKTPILTSDTPGFLVNRVLFPYLGEAIRMVMEGVPPEQLDREVKAFGMPMGPIELLDHVGLDIAAHVATNLRDILPGSDPVVHVLQQMAGAGWTGRKSGRGFYLYDEGKRTQAADLSDMMPSPDDGVRVDDQLTCCGCAPDEGPSVSGLSAADLFVTDGMTECQRRVLYPLLNEAVWCLEEGVVTEPWMIDLAMVLGTGFAPFQGGPMTLIDQIGPEIVLNNMRVLTSRFGERFQASALLAETAGHRQKVSDQHAMVSNAPG